MASTSAPPPPNRGPSTETGPIFSLRGVTPIVGREVYVAPTAAVVGDVQVGDESSIWFGAVVRGDCFPIRIGARTNIQDNAVVHVTSGKAMTRVGTDVTIGHLAMIHGCTIGDRCLVGMGSIVLDGAVIEEECFIAAGTLIPPRMHVPARSFVLGRPGKVVRQVDEREVREIAEAASHYVQYARDFLLDART